MQFFIRNNELHSGYLQKSVQMNIDQILDHVYPIPGESKTLLKNCIKEVLLPKGHLLLRSERVETHIYFIKKGIVRAYTLTKENEITFWFGKEGDTILSMKSYVSSQKGYEYIELIEAGELYRLNFQNLQNFFNEDIHIANWGRRFAEQELLKTEERLISRQFRTASERYNELLRCQGELLQRVPLGHIASYLGITQVTLSRIRAEIR